MLQPNLPPSTRRSLAALCLAHGVSALIGWAAQLEWPDMPIAIRLPLVAAAFMGTLYIDCVRHGELSASEFASAVSAASLRFLPICPLLSVLIGAAFLAIGGACEALALPTAWLNWPVYYGTPPGFKRSRPL